MVNNRLEAKKINAK